MNGGKGIRIQASQGNKPLGKLRSSQEDNIKMDFQEV
jgi:hypothetical protein